MKDLKKTLVYFSLLIMSLAVFTNCRDTEEKTEDKIEEVGEDIEDAAEDVEDEVEDAVDDN